MYRLTHISSILAATFLLSFLTVNSQDATPVKPNNYTGSVNYVRTWDVQAPITDANAITARPLREVKMTTQYFDGLGRPVETVVRQGSLITGGSPVDMVSAQTYDEFGREVRKYLPFASNGTSGSIVNGSFKTDPWDQQVNFYSDINSNSPIKNQGETFYYAKSEHESSPLNRVDRTFAPGNSWVHDGKGIKIKYWINTGADEVRIWNVQDVSNDFGSYSTPTTNGTYPAGTLYKSVTEDERGKEVVEFKDKEGKVILKKVQLTDAAYDDGTTGKDHTGWLCTYYIYDDLGQLRCVIQPKAVEELAKPTVNWLLSTTMLDELCFRYEYDARGRMIMKKVPGAGAVYMVYDARDRLVMTQDANLRSGNPVKWLVTKYDELNRPKATALIESSASRATHQSSADGSIDYPVLSNFTNEILTETFYDNYNWLSSYSTSFTSNYYTGVNNLFYTSSNTYPYPQPLSQSFAINGMVTGTRTKVIGTSQYLYSITYYDDKGRVLQTTSTNITGCENSVTNQYSFSGLLVASYQFSGNCTINLGVGIMNKYEYDDLGRLLAQKKTIYSGSHTGLEKTIVQNEYDALGQLKTKKLAPAYNDNAGLETLSYDYNIRGWMLGINRDYVKDANTTSKFGFDLGYDKSGVIGSYTPLYNGNIAGMVWKSAGDGEKRKYDFGYDNVNRLTQAGFTQWVSGSGSTATFNTSAGLDFSVENLSYDANGNIKTMWQKGWKIAGSDYIDKLSYHYKDGDISNKLMNVVDDMCLDPLFLGQFFKGS